MGNAPRTVRSQFTLPLRSNSPATGLLPDLPRSLTSRRSVFSSRSPLGSSRPTRGYEVPTVSISKWAQISVRVIESTDAHVISREQWVDFPGRSQRLTSSEHTGERD